MELGIGPVHRRWLCDLERPHGSTSMSPDDELGSFSVSAVRGTGTTRGTAGGLRSCAFALRLVRILTRTFRFLCYWMCRHGRCLRSCLARSSRWACCKPSPRRSLHTLHQVCTSLLCVWKSVHMFSLCTLPCPSRRDVHRIPWSGQAICHGQISRLLDPA